MSSEDVDFLCEMLVQLKSLQCLRLSGVSIDDTGAVALAEALKDHTSLMLLDTSLNEITSVGMSTLAPVIRANNIQHLYISGNEKAGSCDDIALAIVDCGNLLCSLSISNANIKTIMNRLFQMKSLVDLTISNCNTICYYNL